MAGKGEYTGEKMKLAASEVALGWAGLFPGISLNSCFVLSLGSEARLLLVGDLVRFPCWSLYFPTAKTLLPNDKQEVEGNQLSKCPKAVTFHTLLLSRRLCWPLLLTLVSESLMKKLLIGIRNQGQISALAQTGSRTQGSQNTYVSVSPPVI
jgi:hypothetical protein